MATKKTTSTTRSRKSTAKKPTTKATAKPAAKPKAKSAPKPAPVKAQVQGVTLEPAKAPVVAINRKAFFERIKARQPDMKGSDIRVVMEAVLEELGATLDAGHTLKLPQLGTLKVQNKKVTGGADIITCKLRRKKPAPEGNDPLAKAAE